MVLKELEETVAMELVVELCEMLVVEELPIVECSETELVVETDEIVVDEVG